MNKPSTFLFPFRPIQDSLHGNQLFYLAKWFLAMRWIAFCAAFLLIFTTIKVLHFLPETLFLPLSACTAVLGLANFIYGILLNRHPEGAKAQILVQVFFDLSILTVMLQFSGGIENPLSFLYIFHVIIAGILLSRLHCYSIAGLAFFLFSSMALLEFRELVPHYTLEIFPHDPHEDIHPAHHGPYVLSIILLQALILFTTAFFITTIMEHLRAREREARESARKEGEARKRLESVVDAAGAGLRLVDGQLRQVWANPRFQAWAGGDEAVEEEARRTLEDGRGRIREHSLQTPDGRERHFATSSFAMRREDGTIHNVVQLIQDVTPMKRAQAEALHAGKLAAIGELAGNIAHEINNPLGVISARIQLLLSRHASELSPKPLADLEKMGELTERISTITRGLLSYSRPSRGENRVFEVRPILERSKVLVEPRAKEKNVRLRFLCPSGLPSLQGDPGELEQVIVNLTLNAIDAAPPKGRVHIQVESIEGPAKNLRMTVADDGPGIPPALRSRVFEPFFSTKEDGKGTGLGLSICEGIVRSLHGTIAVKDSDLGGACFEILLPAADLPL